MDFFQLKNCIQFPWGLVYIYIGMVFLNLSYSKVFGNHYSCDLTHTQSNSLESTNHPQKVVGNVINWDYILGVSIQLALLLIVMLLMQGSFYVANMTISLNVINWNYIFGVSLQLALLLIVILLMQGSFHVANMTILLNVPNTRPHDFW